MTPEWDWITGAGGAGAGAGPAGATAGLAATVFTAGLAAGGTSAFGACTPADAVTLAGAAALMAGFAAGFTLGSSFVAAGGFAAAGVFGAVVLGAGGFSAGLGFRADVNFFTVAGLGGDLGLGAGLEGAIDFGTGLERDFSAISGFAGFAGGAVLPLADAALRFAVMSPLFLPAMLKTPQALGAPARSSRSNQRVFAKE